MKFSDLTEDQWEYIKWVSCHRNRELGEKEPRTGKQLMAFSMFWRLDVNGKTCLDAMDPSYQISLTNVSGSLDAVEACEHRNRRMNGPSSLYIFEKIDGSTG